MKKLNYFVLLFLLFSLFFTACLDNEEGVNITYSYNPIDSVAIEEVMPEGKVTNIITYYNKDNKCQNFYTYDYFEDGSERTVYMILSKLNDSKECSVDSNSYEEVLKFRPLKSGIYTFKFWKGVDDSGNDVFIEEELEIPSVKNTLN